MRETLLASMGPIDLSDLRDDKPQVAAWVTAGLRGKPSLEQLERWSKAGAPTLTALVVQPLVLLQEGLHSQASN